MFLISPMAVLVPLVLALGALLAGAQAPPPAATASPGIISVQGGTFVDADCKAYAFTGASELSLPLQIAIVTHCPANLLPVMEFFPADVWGLLEDEAGVAGSPSTAATLFSQTQAQGINLVRFFPNGVTDAIQLQTAPGVYNEQAWAALDSLIAQVKGPHALLAATHMLTTVNTHLSTACVLMSAGQSSRCQADSALHWKLELHRGKAAGEGSILVATPFACLIYKRVTGSAFAVCGLGRAEQP